MYFDTGNKRLTAMISTIDPIDGGVPTMTRWICQVLEEINIKPILAWYAPWRNHPKLSVPLYRVLDRRPGCYRKYAFDKYEGYGIGAWLPELEFTHYMPTKMWKEISQKCQLHIVVSGNPLACVPFIKLDLPFIAWIATPWEADRIDRVKRFGLFRRWLDTILNQRMLSRSEKEVLSCKNADILTLSNYTARQFAEQVKNKNYTTMLMPINEQKFYPDLRRLVPWRIGFSGRYGDPRKNITLLINAVKRIRDLNYPVELILVGERNPAEIMTLVRDGNLSDIVTLYTHMSPNELGYLLQTFDVFVIPSHQEGLCISALEAMACGVPIVSTRCGGPEDYVLPGLTGILVESTPENLSDAIVSVCKDRSLRDRLSRGAIEWIANHASEACSRDLLFHHLKVLMHKNGLANKTDLLQ